MFRGEYTFYDSTLGRTGTIALQGGQWVGDECVFEFSVPTKGLAGVIRANWRQPEPVYELTDGTLDDPDTRMVVSKVTELLPAFHLGAFDDLTVDNLEEHYAADYHANQNYSVASEFERQRKGVLADLTIELAQPTKVLVAGCSAGECIRQLRTRQVEAYGFDICPQIESVAYPDVRSFVRRGSVTSIPFDPEDGFDTLTAFDVFEHIPETSVPAMVDEFAKLRIHTVIALIAHCEYSYPGHVTLRPLTWWDRMMAPRYMRIPNHQLPNLWPSVVPGNPDPTKLLRVYRATRP